MFNVDKAEIIAKDFLGRMNPTNWNGKGKQPESFDTRIVTYDINSINGNELDISFDYLEEDGWMHYCELRDKASGELIIPLHGYGIDSVQNLVDTIMDVCSEEN